MIARRAEPWVQRHFVFSIGEFFMQQTSVSGVCKTSRFPFRTARVAIAPLDSSSQKDEIARLKGELVRVKRELKELKYATQQFVRSCI